MQLEQLLDLLDYAQSPNYCDTSVQHDPSTEHIFVLLKKLVYGEPMFSILAHLAMKYYLLDLLFIFVPIYAHLLTFPVKSVG